MHHIIQIGVFLRRQELEDAFAVCGVDGDERDAGHGVVVVELVRIGGNGLGWGFRWGGVDGREVEGVVGEEKRDIGALYDVLSMLFPFSCRV